MRPTTVNGAAAEHARGADLDRRVILQHGRHLAQVAHRVGVLEHTVLQNSHTAMTEACERNLTGAPQLGQETVCMQCLAQPISFFSSSALVLS
jgi:hypothetical protein